MKRIFDIVLSFFLLAVLTPVFLFISTFIMFEGKGPVFFVQERIGRQGITFKIFKFRTMIPDVFVVEEYQNYAGDPRVTKLGELLRRLSLDELPQLVNIFLGDMSFVGPRPPISTHPYAFEKYPMTIKKRFNVKPGVTGWAQVNGRNELTWRQKWVYDLYYVDKRNFLFDLYILFLTAARLLSPKGVYDKG